MSCYQPELHAQLLLAVGGRESLGFEGTETKVVREQGTDNEKGDWEVRKLPAGESMGA